MAYPSTIIVSKKRTYAIVWVTRWTSWFFYFHGMPFLLEKTTDRPTTDFQTLAELFLKMSQVSLSFWGKQLTVFVASDKKNWALKRKLEFWKTCINHAKLDSFKILKLLMRSVVMFKDVIVWFCVIKIHQIWNIYITHWMVFLLYLCFLLCHFSIDLRSYFYIF